MFGWLFNINPYILRIKILAGEGSGSSQTENTETRFYWQWTYLASISKNLCSEITEVEWQIFQGKKKELFDTHTHLHTLHTRTLHYTTPHHTTSHTQFRLFCQFLWGAPSTGHVWIWFPPGLLCYALLVHQLYF